MQPPIVLALFSMMLMVFIIAVFLTLRYKQRELQHRERMLAIEKGAPLPFLEETGNSVYRNTYLLRGRMWLFSGIGLLAFLFTFSVSREGIPAYVRVQNANLARNSGATDEQIREIMSDRGERELPLGVSLIALIPIGVGLAYLLTYRREKAL